MEGEGGTSYSGNVSCSTHSTNVHADVNPFLTEFHPDVLVGVRVPQFIVLLAVTHQRVDDVREDHVEVGLEKLPRVRVIHAVDHKST